MAEMTFSANPAAPEVKKGDEANIEKMKEEGWVNIGTIEVVYILKAQEAGRREKTYRENEAASPTALLLKTAAAKGGSLVVVDKDSVIDENDYTTKSGDCIKTEDTANYTYRGGAISGIVMGQRCTEVELKGVYRTTRSSRGSVWRKEPELAKAVKEAETKGWTKGLKVVRYVNSEREDLKCGYKDALGRWVIPPIYNACQPAWSRDKDGTLTTTVYKETYVAPNYTKKYEWITIDIKGEVVNKSLWDFIPSSARRLRQDGGPGS